MNLGKMVKKVTKAATSPSSLAGAGVGFLTGGIPGAVIGYGAGGAMDYYQTAQTAAQNKANRKMVDRANQYDLQMWNLANSYNDPAAQMARLKAAGLNPNLVYGSGNVTGNTAGAPGSNGVAESTVTNRVGNAMQFAQMSANLASTRQEILKSQAQEDYTKAQTKNLNNFLNGTGNSTFNKPNNDVPILDQQPETDFEEQLTQVLGHLPIIGSKIKGLYKFGKASGINKLKIYLPKEETYAKSLPTILFNALTRR